MVLTLDSDEQRIDKMIDLICNLALYRCDAQCKARPCGAKAVDWFYVREDSRETLLSAPTLALPVEIKLFLMTAFDAVTEFYSNGQNTSLADACPDFAADYGPCSSMTPREENENTGLASPMVDVTALLLLGFCGLLLPVDKRMSIPTRGRIFVAIVMLSASAMLVAACMRAIHSPWVLAYGATAAFVSTAAFHSLFFSQELRMLSVETIFKSLSLDPGVVPAWMTKIVDSCFDPLSVSHVIYLVVAEMVEIIVQLTSLFMTAHAVDASTVLLHGIVVALNVCLMPILFECASRVNAGFFYCVIFELLLDNAYILIALTVKTERPIWADHISLLMPALMGVTMVQTIHAYQLRKKLSPVRGLRAVIAVSSVFHSHLWYISYTPSTCKARRAAP